MDEQPAPESIPSTVTVLAKPYWKSVTVWFNLVGAGVLLAGIILDSQDALLLPPLALAWGGVFGLLANGLLLRFAVRQPLGGGVGDTVEVPAPPILGPPGTPDRSADRSGNPPDPPEAEWTKPESDVA